MDTNTTVQSNQPKQSMNPMMIGAVVVGVVLLGGYALFANKDVSSSPQTTPTQVPQVTQKNAVTAPTSSAVSEDIKEFTMKAKKFEFSPATITVKEGDKVKLTINSLDVSHGFAIDELGIKQDIEVGKPTTVEFTATKKGTFRFYCSLFCGTGHREMEGQLIIE
jgi:cytochrome c oxidase subunit 2